MRKLELQLRRTHFFFQSLWRWIRIKRGYQDVHWVYDWIAHNGTSYACETEVTFPVSPTTHGIFIIKKVNYFHNCPTMVKNLELHTLGYVGEKSFKGMGFWEFYKRVCRV